MVPILPREADGTPIGWGDLDQAWAGVRALTTADLQLEIFLSNKLLEAPDREKVYVTHASYERDARGRVVKGDRADRAAFNESIRRLDSIEFTATLKRKVGRKTETRALHGRYIMAERVESVTEPPLLLGMGDPYADVIRWRVIPGAAWLMAREMGQLGRYPVALLVLDPYHDDLAIRLGWYLTHLTAFKLRNDQPHTVSIHALLAGAREVIPTDRRRRGKEFQARLTRALAKLRKTGVLVTYAFTLPADDWLEGTVTWEFHRGSVRELEAARGPKNPPIPGRKTPLSPDDPGSKTPLTGSTGPRGG